MSRVRRPVVKILSTVRSNVHMCLEAVLISVKNGMGTIQVFRENHYSERRYVMLGDKVLAEGFVPTCGTCGDALWAGYGIDNIEQSEIEAVQEAINAPYKGIEHTVAALAPFWGLFSDGIYLIADHEAFPGYCERSMNGGQFEYYFWNGDYRDNSLLHKVYYSGGGKDGWEHYGFPAYLFAGQSPKAFSPHQMEHYLGRLSEGSRFPRAVCMHLGGAMSLVLDGHHKAAAAAYSGENVKCLTIFPVRTESSFKRMLSESQRLFLHSGITFDDYGDYSEPSYGWPVICTKDGVKLGTVLSFSDVAEDSATKISRESGDDGWVSVPEEHYPNLCVYPRPRQYSYATLIPRNHILEEYERFRNEGDTDRNEDRRKHLMNYYEVFKNQKWLSLEQYQRLTEGVMFRNPTD